MSTRVMPVLALLLAAAPPVQAQLETALDIGYDHDHVWRGLTRVTRPSVQPALALAWKTHSWLFSAGGWALLEPWEPRSGDHTIAGRGRVLGELDAWAQADYRLRILSFVVDARAGATRYDYFGDATSGLDEAANTTELFAGLRLYGLKPLFTVLGLPPELPLGVEASVAVDLGDIGGTYVEAGLISELPFFFVGEPVGAASMRLTSGWSWNQEASAPEGGRYAGEGLTHVALQAALTPYLALGPVPATLHVGGNVQYGRDDATRRRAPEGSRWTAWIDVTFSLLQPLRRYE